MKGIILTTPASADGCMIIADSAIGRDAMPLFLPAGEWAATPLWAFRIGRLGKSVSRKFALRYVESCTIAMLAAPAGTEAPAWLGLMDSAITPGRWMPVSKAASAASVHVGNTGLALSPLHAGDLEQAVESVTEKGTIKTGDIILLRAPESQPLPIAPGTVVTASIGDAEVLHLKIK